MNLDRLDVGPVEGPAPRPWEGWRVRAACRGADERMFDDPVRKADFADIADGLGYCDRCPVMFQCRFEANSAVDYPMVGVFGGQYRDAAFAQAQLFAAKRREGLRGRRATPAHRTYRNGRTSRTAVFGPAARDARRRRILAMWQAGATVSAIARELGLARKTASVELSKARRGIWESTTGRIETG